MISTVLTKKQKSTHNYHFSYVKINNPKEFLLKYINYSRLKDYTVRKICSIDFKGHKKEFNNIDEVSKFYNTSRGNIRRWIRKERKHKENISFYYL